MRTRILLTALLFCSIIWNTAKAAESEPNNTAGTADVLLLNGSNTGAIGAAADEDWWSVTTTGDGKLDVTINVSNGQYIWCYIYDNDGTTQLNSLATSGINTVTVDGLATGTYYLKLVAYYTGGTPAYTVSNTLTPPAQANDAEPNGSRAQAKVFPLGGSRTGHINYYYNLARDGEDWWKVTTTTDGKLDITITSYNGQYVWCYLYDNNGTTQLNATPTSGTAVQSTDGLAAGTYYVKIIAYYPTSGFIPYSISNTLTPPAETNDTEPDSTRAQALTLPLNGSTTGHVGYYYDNHRDSVDWYKVTTNADGLLRLSLTPANGQYVWVYLYDNNGTTLINSTYSYTAFNLSTDGLAAGTYYVKVNCYYPNGFAPYTLSDSLFSPVQPNDPEPDSTRAQALTLPLNGSRTGHAGYYYNNHRDSVDWYKVTTNADGQLNVSLTPANGEYVWILLYDNNATTLLASSYSTTAFTISKDGLAPGTYYIKIVCYYNYKFAPYTLSNTLSLYANASDAEPNSKAYQAKTMPANGTVTGHTGFYYNNQRDSADWHKINYTGSGALTVTANFEPTKSLGYRYTYLQIWKDTLAAPIYNTYTIASSLTANLTSLTQGYYWVRVINYYNYEFESYSLTNTFTQSTKAKIVSTGADTSLLCDSLNSITFKCTKSQAPYKVQLKRYGVNYGSTVTVNNANVTFNNLPQGSYSATAYGDGATGNGFGKSDTVSVMPTPTVIGTSAINANNVKTNWTILPCVKYYTVQYRKTTDILWTTVNTTGNVGQLKLVALTAATAYEWQVQSVDSGTNGLLAKSAFTASTTFTTAAVAFASDNTNNESSAIAANDKALMAYPNPASTQFTLQYKAANPNERVSLLLKDLNGKTVWNKNNTVASSLNGTLINVSKLSPGIYMLMVIGENNAPSLTRKIVVSR